MDFINSFIVKAQATVAAREEGQAMVEYGLLAGLISVVAIAAITAVGGGVNGAFDAVRDALTLVAD